MNPIPARLCVRAASAFVLALSLPLAAQEQPGEFSLPQPTPTPTPAPEGPADERAGVAIPPRAVPAPQITPQPILTPEPTPSPRPLALPPPLTAERPTTAASPVPAPRPTVSAAPQSVAAPAVISDDQLTVPPTLSVPLPDSPADAAPNEASTTLPEWWPYAAGGLGGLALMGGGLLLWRRRKPKVLRLAAPPSGMGDDQSAPEDTPLGLALDMALEITGATRSLMMFTLQYRLTLANRTGRAVNDLSLAVRLACARRGADNAASPGAAQRLERVERIGPHQSRRITGEVQLPLSAIAPLHQGRLPLFIPLAHVTLEGEGQRALTRSFVIGTPSAGGTGRLHPIPLDSPGSITGLRAQRVEVPAHSAAT